MDTVVMVIRVTMWMVMTRCYALALDSECLKGCHDELPAVSCSIRQVNCLDPDLRESLRPAHSDVFPSKPESMNIFQYNPRNNRSIVGLNITWTLPNDGSYRYVTGFLIEVIPMTIKNNLSKRNCVYINMTNTQWKSIAHPFHLQFFYSCFPVNFGDYTIHLYSVPIPQDLSSNVAVHSLNVPHPLPKATPPENPDDDTSDPSEWTTPVKYRVNPADGKKPASVTSSFRFAPQKFGFNKYLVKLIKVTTYLDKSVEQKLNVFQNQSPTAQFNNISPGNYNIWVQPYKKDDFNNCLCSSNPCKPCIVSKSARFHVDPATPPPPPPNLIMYLVLPSLGLLILLLIIAVFVIYRKSSSRRCTADPDDSLLQSDFEIQDVDRRDSVIPPASLPNGSSPSRLSQFIRINNETQSNASDMDTKSGITL